MLEIISTINWAKFNVEQLPNIIRRMASDEVRIRHKAYLEFDDDIIHEDAQWGGLDLNNKHVFQLFDAKTHLLLIIILIDMLVSDDFEDKHYILYSLTHMADYINYVNNENVYYAYVKKIHEKIWKYKHLLFEFLDFDDEDVQVATLLLCCIYREYAGHILDRLTTSIARMPNEQKVEKFLSIINGELLQYGKSKVDTSNAFVSHIQNLFDSTTIFELKVACAITLTNILHEKTPDTIIEFVVRMIDGWNIDSKSQMSFYTQVKTIINLGVVKGSRIAFELMDRLQANWKRAYVLVILLMLQFYKDEIPHYGILHSPATMPSSDDWKFTSWTVILLDEFRGKPITDLHNLTSDQLQSIKILLNEEWVWKINTNLFEIFLLPPDSGKLEALI